LFICFTGLSSGGAPEAIEPTRLGGVEMELREQIEWTRDHKSEKEKEDGVHSIQIQIQS
jgi:hypothetical protein